MHTHHHLYHTLHSLDMKQKTQQSLILCLSNIQNVFVEQILFDAGHEQVVVPQKLPWTDERILHQS